MHDEVMFNDLPQVPTKEFSGIWLCKMENDNMVFDLSKPCVTIPMSLSSGGGAVVWWSALWRVKFQPTPGGVKVALIPILSCFQQISIPEVQTKGVV